MLQLKRLVVRQNSKISFDDEHTAYIDERRVAKNEERKNEIPRQRGVRPHADGRRQRLSSIQTRRYRRALLDTFLLHVLMADLVAPQARS